MDYGAIAGVPPLQPFYLCSSTVSIVCTQGVAFYLPTFTDPFKGFLPFPFKYDQNILYEKIFAFIIIGG